MRARIRFEPAPSGWVVETKEWYNLGWKVRNKFWDLHGAQDQAKELALQLLNPQIIEYHKFQSLKEIEFDKKNNS